MHQAQQQNSRAHPCQQHNIIQEIEKAGELKSSRTHKTVFNKIVDIRKVNTENLENREYLVKEIKTLQK